MLSAAKHLFSTDEGPFACAQGDKIWTLHQPWLVLAYRDLPSVSVVWYLGGAGARDSGVHERIDPMGQIYLVWRYQVIRLWQLEAEALLALIGQTRIRDPEATLTQAIRQLVQGTYGEQQERLLAELLLLCSSVHHQFQNRTDLVHHTAASAPCRSSAAVDHCAIAG